MKYHKYIRICEPVYICVYKLFSIAGTQSHIFLYSFIASIIISADTIKAMIEEITSIDMLKFVSNSVYCRNLSQRGIQVEFISMKSSLHVISDVTLESVVTESSNEVSFELSKFYNEYKSIITCTYCNWYSLYH